MKCPLKFRLLDYGAEIERIYTGDCLKEECAWWDEEEQSCDPTGLRHWIKALIAQVWALKEKIPHAGQFTK